MNDAPLTPLRGVMGDAHIGLWMMIGAIIAAGAVYGLQLSKNRSDFHFPKPLWLALFFFYVGVLMYTPTSFAPSALVGPYAYVAYAVGTVAVGGLLASAAALAWLFIFKSLGMIRGGLCNVRSLVLLGLKSLKRQFDKGVLCYCKMYVPDEQSATVQSKK